MGGEVVAPKPSLRLIAEPLTAVGFLAIDVDRNPQSRLKILAPAIKVYVKIPTRRIDSRAVQTDDGVVMILHPNAAFKGAFGSGITGLNVDGQAANVAQEFPADRPENVVFEIKEILVHHERFHRKFVQLKVRGAKKRGAAKQPLRGGIGNEGFLLRLIVDIFGELQSAQKVVIVDGNVAQFSVRLVILKVGLHAG